MRCAVIALTHRFCGIYGGPRDVGIVPVNGHVRVIDVNSKGSDQIMINNHIVTVDVEVDYV